MGEICPQNKSYPPVSLSKINFNPSQIIIILRLNLPTPPPSPLKKVSSHRFPHTYFTCWISSSGTNITSNDSNESFEESSGSLDSELVSSSREFGDSSSSTASLALGFPHAWLRTQEFLSDWAFFFFLEAQFNHTVFDLPYFKFVSLLKFQQLGFFVLPVWRVSKGF